MTTFNSTYSAVGSTNSSMKMNAPMLGIEIHQMIVWMMHNEADAMSLVPVYKAIREAATHRTALEDQAEAGMKAIAALAEIRDMFPVPEPNAVGDAEYIGAMASPDSIKEFVKVSLANYVSQG